MRAYLLPSQTADGKEFILRANIEGPSDVECAQKRCERRWTVETESLFLRDNTFPNEEQQFEYYKAVVEGVAPRTVTIRTLDLGGDKSLKVVRVCSRRRRRIRLWDSAPYAFA